MLRANIYTVNKYDVIVVVFQVTAALMRKKYTFNKGVF